MLVVFTSALNFALTNVRVVDPYADRRLQLKSVVGATGRLVTLQSINVEFKVEALSRTPRGSRCKVLSAVPQFRVLVN